MLDLPILRAEARVSARSWPTYATRAAYGLFLLRVFWVFRQYHNNSREGVPT
jgi:hypothetical protein